MNELDETMRQTLLEPAPRAVQDRVQPRFDTLRARFHPAQNQTGPGSSPFLRSHAWWWTTLGVFGAAGLVLLLMFPHASLRAEVDFVGVMSTKAGSQFFLQDRAAGTTSGWVTLNQKFAGFTLSSYDATTDLLVLTKDKARVEIRLKDAKVPNGRIELRGTVEIAALGETFEMERITLLLEQDNVFTLKNGVEVRANPSRMTDGNFMWSMAFVRPRADGTKETLSGPAVVTRPDQEWSILIGSVQTPDKNLSVRFKPPGK